MFIKIEIYVYTRIHCGFRRLSNLSQVCASPRAVMTGRRDKSRNQHSGTHSGHTASMRKWINFLATVRQFSNSAQKISCVYTNAVSYRYGFAISKPHRNRCGLEVFTRNRFRTVYVMPKLSHTKGIWVRKNLPFCPSQHGEKYMSVHLE